MSSALRSTARATSALKNAICNQTMIRVRDPKASLNFYQNVLDMKLVDEKHFSDFSLYFLATLPNNVSSVPELGSPEAARLVNTGAYGCIVELTHNHGTENDPSFSYHTGNVEPLGFGHIGFLSDEVKELVEKVKDVDGNVISEAGNEASIEDPDGYRIYVKQRQTNAESIVGRPSFHHAMIRVKDPTVSLLFYRDVCGMTLVDEIPSEDGTSVSYFVGYLTEQQKKDLPEVGTIEAHRYLDGYPGTLFELRHIKGTETDETFAYHNGNSDPRGFGHLALMVEDVYETSAALEEAGAVFQKRPDEGRMKGLAFVKDPDGYWIELIEKNREVPESKTPSN